MNRVLLPLEDISTPTTNGQVVILYQDEPTILPPLRERNIRQLSVHIDNDQAGTLNLYTKLSNGASSWSAFASDAITASGAANRNMYSYPLPAMGLVKVEFVNGASAQTVWGVTIEGMDIIGGYQDC